METNISVNMHALAGVSSSTVASFVAEATFYMVRHPSIFAVMPREFDWWRNHTTSSIQQMNAEIRAFLRSRESLAERPLISFTRSAITVLPLNKGGTSKVLR